MSDPSTSKDSAATKAPMVYICGGKLLITGYVMLRRKTYKIVF